MPLDRLAVARPRADRSMLAAAFILFCARRLLDDYWCVDGTWLPGVTVWPWYSAVGAQLTLPSCEAQG